MLDFLNKILINIQFNRKKQQDFLEDLASLLADGVSLKEAIETIETISTGSTQKVAQDIHSALARGQNMANGLTNWFPSTIIEMIRTGENSGTLNNALSSAAQNLKQTSFITHSIIHSTLYPLIVLILALIMLVFIKESVLENFANIKPLSQWPSHGITLYHFATLIEYGWWIIFLMFFMTIFITYKFIISYTGQWRNYIDTLPILKLYRDNVAARFMQTLGTLMSNGIVIRKALTILCYDANPYLTWHILAMEARLGGGIDNIAEILDTNLLKPNELLRLKIIAKGKGFALALIRLGEQSAKRNQQSAIIAGKILGALLLTCGAIIAVNIIFGIYTVGSILAH